MYYELGESLITGAISYKKTEGAGARSIVVHSHCESYIHFNAKDFPLLVENKFIGSSHSSNAHPNLLYHAKTWEAYIRVECVICKLICFSGDELIAYLGSKCNSTVFKPGILPPPQRTLINFWFFLYRRRSFS